MAVKYDKAQADDAVHGMALTIMEQYHSNRLKLSDDTYPTLTILWAHTKDGDEEPPLKDRGRPVAAVLSIIGYKQRVDDRRDAELVIDKRHWEQLTEGEQLALLDHAITGLQISIDDGGFANLDDAGRPRMKLRPYDFVVQGWRETARRHGANAPEVRAAVAFEKEYGGDVLAKDALFS